MKVYVINGPNINLLGTREPEIYGYETLDDISEKCIEIGKTKGIDVKFMQSNYEGDLVSWIQDAIKNKIDAIVINAAAYTHTSIAIHDAFKSFSGFKVELHISNPHLRESFQTCNLCGSCCRCRCCRPWSRWLQSCNRPSIRFTNQS